MFVIGPGEGMSCVFNLCSNLSITLFQHLWFCIFVASVIVRASLKGRIGHGAPPFTPIELEKIHEEIIDGYLELKCIM